MAMSDDANDPRSHLYARVARVVGAAPRDCTLLVHRSHWDDFEDDESTESLVVRSDADGFRVIARAEGAAQDLWGSPSGRLFVVGALDGRHGLHVGMPTEGAYAWTRIDALDEGAASRVRGVWGLGDDLVFAWGGGAFHLPGDDEASPRMLQDPPVSWCFDGSGWRTQSAPAAIFAVHGSSPEHIVAVGKAMIARWTSGRWERVASPNLASLSFVAVSGVDALAATFRGELFEITPRGCRAVAQCEGAVHGLARWNDRWVVASRPKGLLTLEDDRLEALHDTWNVGTLHAGRALLWTCEAGLMGTVDFTDFEWVHGEALGAALGAEYWPE